MQSVASPGRAGGEDGVVTLFWAVVGGLLLVLLLVSWRMDRSARRRGARVLHHRDVWSEVRESRRDAEVMDPRVQDDSWTSWNRRQR
jgi:hypothetical protein